MRVLYLGQFSPYYRTENYVTYALRQNGCTVHCCEVSGGTDYGMVQRLLREHAIELVLFSKFELPYARLLIDYCRARGIVTVAWMWDLFWGYRRTRPAQWRADLLFTTDGGHNEEFAKYRANHRVLRQGIHEPEHRLLPPKYGSEGGGYDVAFVGGRVGHPSRRRLVDWLRSNYRGRFIHHTATRGMDLNYALSKVRIVVGDSYPSPMYYSNRVYEITGRGGFLLHPETEGLGQEFASGQHYAAYERGNWEQLAWLIDYYLRHENERECIRRDGFRHCGRYTYTARVATLLEHVRQHAEALTPLAPPSV